MHEGSQQVSAEVPHVVYKTFIDGVTIIVAGCAHQVQKGIVMASLCFNKKLAWKRKSKLSDKTQLLQMVANCNPEIPQSKPNEAKEGLLKMIGFMCGNSRWTDAFYYPLNVDKNQNVGTKLNYVPFYTQQDRRHETTTNRKF